MTYLGQPLLDIAPDFSRLDAGLLDDFTFEPQGVGAATPWKVTSGPRRTVTYPFTLGSRSDILAFRAFVADRQGALLGFWLPVYLRDYEILNDAALGSSTVNIRAVDLAGAVLSFTQFKHLILSTATGLQAYAISTVTSSGDVEIITLSSPLTSNLTAKSTLCGGLIFARFNDDQCSYSFRGLDFAQLTVKFIELPKEYTTPETGSAPIYLYLISRGANSWRYAGWGVDVTTEDSSTWQSADITHGEIKAGVEFLSESLSLTVATDDPAHPFRYFLDATGSEMTTVSIYEVDDSNPVLGDPIYVGQCVEPKFGKKGVIDVSLTSIFRIAEQNVPQVTVKRTCVHDLFDPRCGLAEHTFLTAGALTGVSTNPAWIEAAEFGAQAAARSDPNYFALGKVTIGTQKRLCVGQVGNRLYLNAPLAAGVGKVVQARPGCDKRVGTCENKFHNTINFLGFPYMPNKNPQFQALEQPKAAGGKKS